MPPSSCWPRLTMLVTYAPPISSIKHAVFFTKRCFFLRCSFTLSSHCSQVYPHSQIITFAVPRASTVLLVSLFVLGYWLAADPSFQSVVLVHDLFSVLPRHDHTLLFTNACTFLSSLIVFRPLYHLLSLHPAKGFAFQAPEYILFTPSTHPVVSL